MPVTIRLAVPDDAKTIAALVKELAAYEKRSHQARPKVKALKEHLDPASSPCCEAFLAEDEQTEKAVGFALFYPTYSTFHTNWGLHLEDLYVKKTYRGSGVGTLLMQRLAQEAQARDYRWLQWNVLHWNKSAMKFYEKLGAQTVDDWAMMFLAGRSLKRLSAAD